MSLALAAVAPRPAISYELDIVPIKDHAGKKPKVVMVEEPQDAVRAWRHLRKKTVVVISESLGIASIDDKEWKKAYRLFKRGRLRKIIAKDYPTPRGYPINPYTYLCAAYRAGIIDKVYWVPPTKNAVGQEPLDRFKGYLSQFGVPPEDLAGITQKEKSIEGKFNGLPVYICYLTDLPKMDGDVLLLIDLPFFTPYYEDEITTPIMDLFGSFIGRLGGLKMHVSRAAVSYSTGLGTFPLDNRYLGDYLRTYLTRPKILKDGPPPLWQTRAEALNYTAFFQPDDAVNSCLEAVKMAPKNASLRYALAFAYLDQKDLIDMDKELGKAVFLDRHYYPAYFKAADYLIKKDMTLDAEFLLQKALKVNPADPRAYDLLNTLYVNEKNFSGAADALKKKIALGFGGPDSFETLADTYRKGGSFGLAEESYQKALSMIPVLDTNDRFKMTMDLAGTYEDDRKIDKALELYDQLLKSLQDEHSKEQVQAKRDELESKWAPFMGGKK
ncbi:MAG: hypothetical protein ABSG42_05475 [Nitrospirota bacterium]